MIFVFFGIVWVFAILYLCTIVGNAPPRRTRARAYREPIVRHREPALPINPQSPPKTTQTPSTGLKEGVVYKVTFEFKIGKTKSTLTQPATWQANGFVLKNGEVLDVKEVSHYEEVA